MSGGRPVAERLYVYPPLISLRQVRRAPTQLPLNVRLPVKKLSSKPALDTVPVKLATTKASLQLPPPHVNAVGVIAPMPVRSNVNPLMTMMSGKGPTKSQSVIVAAPGQVLRKSVVQPDAVVGHHAGFL
jgi:hypothetical protein